MRRLRVEPGTTLQFGGIGDFVKLAMQDLTIAGAPMIGKLWPSYERAAIDVGLPKQSLGTELVLGGWLPKYELMVATAYAKNVSATPGVVQQPDEGVT